MKGFDAVKPLSLPINNPKKQEGIGMKVSRQELVEGCIVLEDIYSVSPNPILTKKTVLNSEHLDVLRAFLIEEVTVHDFLENGEPFTPFNTVEKDKGKTGAASNQGMTSSYNDAVLRYKEQFSQWQNGVKVNLLGLQAILYSLINVYNQKPNDLFRLHEKTKEEDYIFHHGVTVGLVSAYLAKKLGYPKKECQEIGLSGLLMDCGMSKIPSHYLVKTVELDSSTTKQLANHPVFGYQMLKNVDQLSEGILLGVLQHHERENGSGYPMGVKGNKIHHYAKVIMVADTYHAMVSQRHYRPRISPFTALEILNQDKSHYDYKVVTTLIKEITHLFVGTRVKLSNEKQGEIIFIPTESPTRPMVRLDDGQAIALNQHPSLLIEDVL